MGTEWRSIDLATFTLICSINRRVQVCPVQEEHPISSQLIVEGIGPWDAVSGSLPGAWALVDSARFPRIQPDIYIFLLRVGTDGMGTEWAVDGSSRIRTNRWCQQKGPSLPYMYCNMINQLSNRASA
jgi:hypothetical protein